MASRAAASLGQLPIHLGVDLVQPGLGDHAPADRRLVGHQDADEPRTAESRERLGGTGQEADMGRVGEVMDVLDQSPVTVEKNCRPRSRVRGSRRAKEFEPHPLGLARAPQ